MRGAVLVAVCGLVGGAQASIFHFVAHIDGAQDNTLSPATGVSFGHYDTVANTYSFDWSITDNLIGTPATPGAHIHNAAEGSNGPIVFHFSNPDGTWPLVGNATWNNVPANLVDELFAGRLYVNFHTTAHPAGEVRGQIYLIPSPASAVLFGIGALVLAHRRR